jgi:hypothetical protein
MTDTTTVHSVDVDTDTGDHDKFTHYVHKDNIMENILDGQPCIALCGKVWSPTSFVKEYQTCPACKDIYDQLPE